MELLSRVLRSHIREDLEKNSPWLVAFIGMLTGIAMIFMAIVLERSTAEMMSVFTNSEILFTVLIAMFWLQEKFTKIQFFGFIIALLGFLMISSFSSEIDIISIILVLLAALQNILVKKYSHSLNPFSMAFVRMLFMGNNFYYYRKLHIFFSCYNSSKNSWYCLRAFRNLFGSKEIILSN